MKSLFPAIILVPVLALGCIARTLAAPSASSYQCGGVGQSEQVRFKAEAHHHDALVTFATRAGAYVADVDFRLTRPNGVLVLQGTCDGPLLLFDVPDAGPYRLEAEFDGHSQSKTIHLGPKTSRLSFLWAVS